MNATGPDITEQVSAFPFDATLQRLEAAMAAAGLSIFARIDHAEGARSVGLSMPPTIVLLYGNPRGGTPIMQAEPRAALDLPLRVLVRQTPDGAVIVSHRPARAVLLSLGLAEDLAGKLDPAQRLLKTAISTGEAA
jgi:uncharacterized protein (DUF302 family)